MSVEIVAMVTAVAWMHGRFYPWTKEYVEKQKARAFERRVEKANQKWYGARFGKESAH
ncbi:hypothetical protein SEA_MULCHROOM_16 [Streptomyces phage Mulchroom]|nr:hypothetical protein SEA_MULCHROOM_16 [Streptomyces phage Mulchroom]